MNMKCFYLYKKNYDFLFLPLNNLIYKYSRGAPLNIMLDNSNSVFTSSSVVQSKMYHQCIRHGKKLTWCRRIWSFGCWSLLPSDTYRTFRRGRTLFSWVPSCDFSSLGNPIPRVTKHHRTRGIFRTRFWLLFLIIKGIWRRGWSWFLLFLRRKWTRAGRYGYTCGWARCWFLLGFWLDKSQPGWVFWFRSVIGLVRAGKGIH